MSENKLLKEFCDIPKEEVGVLKADSIKSFLSETRMIKMTKSLTMAAPLAFITKSSQQSLFLVLLEP